jgi:SAM-dependent methyltransferase
VGTAEMKMYLPVNGVLPGESWRGEQVEENYALCRFQPNMTTITDCLNKTDKILDAGCGYGRYVKYLGGLGYDIVGIDSSEDAVSVAKENDLDVCHGDIRQIPYENDSFDAIICFGVVEHIEEGVEEVLSEFYRVLTDKGKLFISIPTQNIVRYFISNPLKIGYRYLRMLWGVIFEFEEYRYSRLKFRNILFDAGFNVIEELPDDLLSPLNLGLYVDYPFLRSDRVWELNRTGRVIQHALEALSPWIANGNTLWICQKKSNPHS